MEVHLGFWLQVFLKAEIIQNCLGAMRLGHIRRLTHSPCSDAISLCLSHAWSLNLTLAKSCKTSRVSCQDISRLFHGRCCDMLQWSSNKQPCGIWLGASCHLINLQSWKVELKPPLESVPDRCQPAQHSMHTGLVQNTLNPNLAVSNFVAEGPWKQPLWIQGSGLVSLMFLYRATQTLGKSEGAECTSTL